MNSYRYRVTVEQIADGKGQPVQDGRTLQFEAACHDEMLGIVDRTREKKMMDAEMAAAAVIGLKLLGEIAIAERKQPMFGELHTALGTFIRALKAWPEKATGSPVARAAAE